MRTVVAKGFDGFAHRSCIAAVAVPTCRLYHQMLLSRERTERHCDDYVGAIAA